MKKLLAILWKDLVLRLGDPAVLLLAFAMPLAITALIELAFGGVVLGTGLPNASIPVGIVDQDLGGTWGTYGQVFARVLDSAEAPPLPGDPALELFEVRKVKNVDRALGLTDAERLVGAVLIPPDFSEALAAERAAIHLVINDRHLFRGVAFRSAIETVANLISTGEVTVRTAIQPASRIPHLRIQLESGELDDALSDLVQHAVHPLANPIQVRRLPRVGPAVQIDLAHYLAASVAIFFAGYTALLTSASILQEKGQRTWHRMVVTPTRPQLVLAGKALAVYLKGLGQMAVLFAAVALLPMILRENQAAGPRLNPFGLLLLIPAVVTAAIGVGVVIAGLARTYALAANYGRAILLVMALAGGTFFPVDLYPESVQALSRLTYHYWAMDGYMTLALGGPVISILPNVLVLSIMGLLLCMAGGLLLRRRLELV